MYLIFRLISPQLSCIRMDNSEGADSGIWLGFGNVLALEVEFFVAVVGVGC